MEIIEDSMYLEECRSLTLYEDVHSVMAFLFLEEYHERNNQRKCNKDYRADREEI